MPWTLVRRMNVPGSKSSHHGAPPIVGVGVLVAVGVSWVVVGRRDRRRRPRRRAASVSRSACWSACGGVGRVGGRVGGPGVLVGVFVGVLVGTAVLVGVFVGVLVGTIAVLVGVFVGVLVGRAVLVGVFVGVLVGRRRCWSACSSACWWGRPRCWSACWSACCGDAAASRHPAAVPGRGSSTRDAAGRARVQRGAGAAPAPRLSTHGARVRRAYGQPGVAFACERGDCSNHSHRGREREGDQRIA